MEEWREKEKYKVETLITFKSSESRKERKASGEREREGKMLVRNIKGFLRL